MNIKKSFHQFAAIGMDKDGKIDVKARFVFPRLE